MFLLVCAHKLTGLDHKLHTFKACGTHFNTCMPEQQWDNPRPLEFPWVLLEQRCLSAEHGLLVEWHQAVEKGFFWQGALQNSRKHTLREAPFISYANLESTWHTTDSRVAPGSGTVSLVLGPHPLCLWFTGWISMVVSSSLMVWLIET